MTASLNVAAEAEGVAAAVPTAPAPSPYDTLIPKIPNVCAEDIQAWFKVKAIPKIEGRPSYQPLNKIFEMLQRSAMPVETSLGGRNHGHLGLVMKDVLYQTETGGTSFTIPASGGLLPMFTPNAMEAEKHTAMAKFIVRENDIKKTNLTEKLLRNQLTDAITEEYYQELKDATYGYDRVPLHIVMGHLFTNYSQKNASLINKTGGPLPNQPTCLVPSTCTSTGSRNARSSPMTPAIPSARRTWCSSSRQASERQGW